MRREIIIFPWDARARSWMVPAILFVGFLVATGFAVATPALARDEVRRPVRLTAGESNQFMGVLGPDGRTLFFASDQAGTTQVFVQDVRSGGPRLLHDFDADVTWPRPSPDGRHLLFLDYRDDAAGDVCVWDLTGDEMRCLTGPGTADLQAFWFPDGRSVGVVQREGLHADLVLRRIPASGGPGEVVVSRSLSSPAISPDGRFVAYIPVDRLNEAVGVTFAMRVGSGIEVGRLTDGDQTGTPAAPITYKPDLPGVSGFPAFSADGKWLYFTQYLNDTNGDGTIDGNDHGILFRVAFDATAVRTDSPGPFAGAVPEQLTSARWNCQYPAPAADRLVMTCSYEGSLDIYSLPLEGALPREWGTDRIEAEVRASRDHWERLLLLGRAAALEGDASRRIEQWRRMAHLHLEVREFASATFYARAVARLAGEGSPAAEWANVLLEVIRHREAEGKLVQGQLSERFIEGERKRLERLAAFSPASRAVRALVAVARSEVLDVLGDEAGAAQAMSDVDLERLDDWQVVLMAARRVVERGLLVGDREGLLAATRTLSGHAALDLTDRLFFANAYAETLLRGVADRDRLGLVEAHLTRTAPETELRLRLELERWLLGMGQRDPEDVRKGIFELYRGVKDLERRKALVLTTARRAASADEEYLLYEFSNSFVSWLKRAEPERRRAEDLYRLVVLERAYAKWAKGEVSDARGLFFGATLQSDCLEAHIGAIETRIAEGGRDVIEHYRERYKDGPDSPVLAFVLAYLAARDLPGIEDAAFEAKAAEALRSLRVAADAYPNAFEVHHLWGFLAHQRYLRGADAAAAMEAHTHYLLAIDLARDNPRALAALHEAEALLQAELGNHPGALRHFERRAVWPFSDPQGEAAFLLARARSLFHVDRDEEAAATADRALAVVGARGDLAWVRVLALDRAALFHLSAGHFERAAALYDERLREMDATEPAWNRVKALVGLGAAALGAGEFERALGALAGAREALAKAPPMSPSLGAGGRPRTFDAADFASLVAALRAHAFAGLGRMAEARDEMETRRLAVAERLRRLNLDEDLLDLATAHHLLARYAWQGGDRADAAAHVVEGLRAVREFEERTGTVVTSIGNRLLVSYGELRTAGGEAATDMPADLEAQMRRVYEFMSAHPNPAWEEDRFLVGLTLGILDAGSAARRGP